MYHILPKSKGNVIGIRVEGWMSAKDDATLLPFVENKIKEYGTIRILLDLRKYKGSELSGILKSIPYAFKFISKVEKEAVITDQKWIYTWAKLFAPFFKTKARCFPSTAVEQAWNWVEK